VTVLTTGRRHDRGVSFLLVHSPVVGPATWRWVGDALRDAGETVIVPDLVDPATSGDPLRFVSCAASTASSDDGDVVLVGHSGAGCLLPRIAHLLSPRPRLIVFVDAGVPPCDGDVLMGGTFLGTLQSLAVGGRLPPWSRWWGDDVMDRLVDVPERRAAIEAELPIVPLRFYEMSIAMPPGWCDTPSAYVLLSPGYRPDAVTASGRGWPVVERLGAHLDMANDERAIASILIDLALRPRGQRRRTVEP
jgi:hypothetical protein